jgi:hypothetical protein
MCTYYQMFLTYPWLRECNVLIESLETIVIHTSELNRYGEKKVEFSGPVWGQEKCGDGVIIQRRCEGISE